MPVCATAAKFATVAGRLRHQEELDEHIEAWTRTLGKYEVTERSLRLFAEEVMPRF